MYARKIAGLILISSILLSISCNSTVDKSNKTIQWQSAPWQLQKDNKPLSPQEHKFINFTNI
jgi:hypothetical protein